MPVRCWRHSWQREISQASIYLQDLDPLWTQARALLKERSAEDRDDVAHAQALLDQFELESASSEKRPAPKPLRN